MTFISFLRKSDTLQFAHSAQSLEKMPHLTYQTLERIKSWTQPDFTEEFLKNYEIRRWQQPDIMEYCVNHWLDLMIIENCTPDGSIQVVEFEVPPEYVIERLNKSML